MLYPPLKRTMPSSPVYKQGEIANMGNVQIYHFLAFMSNSNAREKEEAFIAPRIEYLIYFISGLCLPNERSNPCFDVPLPRRNVLTPLSKRQNYMLQSVRKDLWDYPNPAWFQHVKYSIYCITCNVNVYLFFPNLPNGFETVTIKTLSLIFFVGMVWQTMFA